MQPTDEALMEAYQQGQRGALGTLVGRYEKRVWNFVRRFVQPTAAEDIVQETFLRVVRSAPEWSPQSRFSSWLFTIARNLCRDEARRLGTQGMLSLDSSGTEDDSRSEPSLARVASKESSAETQHMDRETRRLIEKALEGLPEEQREVFVMREFGELSFADIAQITNCPEGTVKSRMRYALESLRMRLGGEHGPPGAAPAGVST